MSDDRHRSYFCNPCRGLVPIGQRCKHWTIDNALAAYSCFCGREGLAPDWDWHCMECHQDFTKLNASGVQVGDRDAFYAHTHAAKVPRKKVAAAW